MSEKAPSELEERVFCRFGAERSEGRREVSLAYRAENLFPDRSSACLIHLSLEVGF